MANHSDKRPSKVERKIQEAEQLSKQTNRQVVVTIVINPDAPNQMFTGTIAGRFDMVYETN